MSVFPNVCAFIGEFCIERIKDSRGVLGYDIQGERCKFAECPHRPIVGPNIRNTPSREEQNKPTNNNTIMEEQDNTVKKEQVKITFLISKETFTELAKEELNDKENAFNGLMVWMNASLLVRNNVTFNTIDMDGISEKVLKRDSCAWRHIADSKSYAKEARDTLRAHSERTYIPKK